MLKPLKTGGHIRVVSPSSSIHRLGGFEANLAAKEKLESLGFKLSFSSNYLEPSDCLDSAPIASRVADLHESFADPSIDAVLATIGGNLSTFGLLHGTPYAPQPDQYVLFLEEGESDDYIEFNRHLAAILQAYPNPQAVLIGRFPKECQMTEETLLYILDKHPVLKTIPVLYDLDFAHTQPLFSLRIGGQVTVDTTEMNIRFD